MALYNKLPTLRSIRVLSFKKPAITTGEKTAGSTVSDPGTQAVCCEMSVIPLTESEPFDALSYVWGNPSIKDGSMVCNGHTIDITPNLWAALTQIWRNWPQKRLWVDAVCINQQDIPERNQQVTMMGAIYRTAQCVVVWLGEPTEASDTVFELLEEVKDEPGGGSAENATMGAGAYNTTALKDRARDVGRLGREILSRPWFERAWTLQEIQLARRATICCGSRHADFGRFVQLVQRYNDEQFKESACGGDSLRVPVLPSSAGEGEEKEEDGTLFYHLAETSDRVASDPRDKLYCLLSLLPEDLYDFLEADYSLSVQETIVRASRICIELDEETGCLADAGLENRVDGTLPSWALDWRIPHDYDHHKKFNPIGRQLRTEGKEGEEGGGPERQRLRRDRGRNLQSPIDNTYRVDDKKLRIRGGALGRLELSETTKEENKDKAKYKHEQTARLSVFPECAMRWLGKPPDLKVPTWVELPDGAFRGFLGQVRWHEKDKCDCLEGRSRVEYPLRNLPRGTRDGDWLWQRANVGRDYDFILRPVWGSDDEDKEKKKKKKSNNNNNNNADGGEKDGKREEVCFQLVGEAWGQGIRGPFTRIRDPLRHSEIVAIVANFVLV